MSIVRFPVAAQTVLPLSPQAQALVRCDKMAVVRPGDAEAAAREALAASAITPDQRAAASACLAAAQLFSGREQDGAASLDVAMKQLDAPGVTPVGRLEAQLRLASLLLRVGRLDEALKMQQTVLAGAREHNIVPLQLQSLRFIGQVRANEFDDPEGALPYYQQAYDLYRSLPAVPGMRPPVPAFDLGELMLRLGRLDDAEPLLAEAAAGAATMPEMAGLIDRVDMLRIEILRQRGHPAEAEKKFAAALERARASNDMLGEGAAQYGLARSRLDLGRAQEALAPARAALAVAEAGKYPYETRGALELLADVSTALGQGKEALDYATRAREVGRGLDRQATERRLASLQAQAAGELASAGLGERAGQAYTALLRNIAIAVLGGLTLFALALAMRAQRRQRELAALGDTDSLTGLPNRRSATRRIEALAAGEGARTALLLIDIDRFKRINDQFGHDAGDRALNAVADCLRRSCDAGDLVARWGGEEFLVLRENTTQEAAFALAAHLRAQVERLQVTVEEMETPLQLSASIGVASLPLFAESGSGWQDALRAADRALYAGKRAGRNAWVGLWGIATGIDAKRALADVPEALAEGWLVAGGNRPLDWMTAPSSRKTNLAAARIE
ncbi:MAG: diguanylate cyclase [Pseudoxanthomonas sp.]